MFSQADVWMCDKAANYLDKVLISLQKELLLNNLNKKSYTCTFELLESVQVIPIHVRMTVSPAYESFGDIEVKFYKEGVQYIINGNLKFIFKNYASLLLKLSSLFPKNTVSFQNKLHSCTQHYIPAV